MDREKRLDEIGLAIWAAWDAKALDGGREDPRRV